MTIDDNLAIANIEDEIRYIFHTATDEDSLVEQLLELGLNISDIEDRINKNNSQLNNIEENKNEFKIN